MNDQELLESYTADKSDNAFKQIVDCHIALVYATALRTVRGDAELARDVARLVFVNLTLKAQTLRADVALPGWFLRNPVLTTLEILRKRRRRHALEEQVVALDKYDPGPAEDVWGRILPLLDIALSQIHAKDRDVLLMRFFIQQSLAAIGEQFGFGESGAGHRVFWALDKLRGLLAACEVTIAGGAWAAIMGPLSTGMVSAGLASMVSSATLVAGAAITSAFGSGVGHLLAPLKVKLGLIDLAETIGVSPLVLQRQTIQVMQWKTFALEQQVQGLHASLPLLPTPQTIPTELLRLRGQVAGLCCELDERSAPRARLTPPAGLSPTQLASLSGLEHWRGGKSDSPTFTPRRQRTAIGLPREPRGRRAKEACGYGVLDYGY